MGAVPIQGGYRGRLPAPPLCQHRCARRRPRASEAHPAALTTAHPVSARLCSCCLVTPGSDSCCQWVFPSASPHCIPRAQNTVGRKMHRMNGKPDAHPLRASLWDRFCRSPGGTSTSHQPGVHTSNHSFPALTVFQAPSLSLYICFFFFSVFSILKSRYHRSPSHRREHGGSERLSKRGGHRTEDSEVQSPQAGPGAPVLSGALPGDARHFCKPSTSRATHLPARPGLLPHPAFIPRSRSFRKLHPTFTFLHPSGPHTWVPPSSHLGS